VVGTFGGWGERNGKVHRKRFVGHRIKAPGNAGVQHSAQRTDVVRRLKDSQKNRGEYQERGSKEKKSDKEGFFQRSQLDQRFCPQEGAGCIRSQPLGP